MECTILIYKPRRNLTFVLYSSRPSHAIPNFSSSKLLLQTDKPAADEEAAAAASDCAIKFNGHIYYKLLILCAHYGKIQV